MMLDYKINTVREALNSLNPTDRNEKIVFEFILNILQDISDEIDELNDCLLC
jgi:hypothetical protein